jgi:rfaE bifunctional protein kinase chain/domain
VTPGLVAYLRNTLGRWRPGQAVSLLVDSRYDMAAYTRVTLVTPNESELEEALGLQIGDDLSILEQAGRRLLQQLRAEAALVTRGSRGMALFERGRPATHIPVYGTDEVSDVTGAGDTVIATTALAVAAGGNFVDAAHLANYAAGLVVMKRGTATVSSDELREAILASDSLHGTIGLASTA